MSAKSAIILALQILSSQALNVIQWQDNMVISANTFIDLKNNNEATLLSNTPQSVQQGLQLDLVRFFPNHEIQSSNFQNSNVDILVFSANDTKAYDCYVKAVAGESWSTFNCDMTSVQMVLNVDTYTYLLTEITDNVNIDKQIVIDNTPIPIGGANANRDVTFQLQIITDFNMPYNIKTLTMYAGLLCLSLFLIILATMYICCKTRNDVVAKK